jgi:hypothetical protein
VSSAVVDSVLRRRRLRRGVAIAAVAVAAAAAAGAQVGPIERLANYRPDPPGPIYDDPGVDDRLLKRAASLLPAGATYGVYGNPLYDLQGGSPLYFEPNLQLPPEVADWVLSYHAPRRLPPDLHALETKTVAPGVFLIRVRPR